MPNLFDGIHSLGAAQVAPIVQAVPAEQHNLFDSAVILNLTFRSFGTSRKLKASEYEVDADKSKTSAAKGICSSKELKAIKTFDSETRKLIEMRTLPSQYKSGLYLLKIDAIDIVDTLLQDRQVVRQNLIEEFIGVYPDLKARDALSAEAGGLGGLYKDEDYPSIETVRKAFAMDYSYSEFSTPGRLASINKVIYDRERDKAQTLWHSAIEDGQALLRGEFAGLVEHMRERLTPETDGKPRKFKDTLVVNVLDFLSTFDARDIAQDAALKALVAQASSMLQGVTPADLRKSATVKARVQANLESIKGTLDTLIVDAPVRRITFSDDDWGSL